MKKRQYIDRVLVVLIFFVLILFSPSAWAVPKLQIYIPGAAYDTVTETWTINAADYDLWIIGATAKLYDVQFAIGVPENENGSIDITWLQGKLTAPNGTILKQPNYFETLNETSAFFHGYGTPVMNDGKSLPPHDVFPTSYYEYLIGNFGTGQTVQNYQPGGNGDTAKGEIKKFHIAVEGYSSTDIVAYGDYLKKVGKKTELQSVFSPFSHDGHSDTPGNPVPEPATMLLLGSGLIGLGTFGRKKFTKKLATN